MTLIDKPLDPPFVPAQVTLPPAFVNLMAGVLIIAALVGGTLAWSKIVERNAPGDAALTEAVQTGAVQTVEDWHGNSASIR